LTIVERAKFRRMVRPGDRLLLEARVLLASDAGGQIRGTVRVQPAEEATEPGEAPVAAEAELTFALAVVRDPALVARRRQIVDTWLHGSAEER
jgi:hypothetical protein